MGEKINFTEVVKPISAICCVYLLTFYLKGHSVYMTAAVRQELY